MRFLKYAAAAAVLVATSWLTTPAAADGKPKSQKPAASQSRNYTGCYAGVHAGGSIAATEIGIGMLAVDSIASTGAVGGVHGGCDVHFTGTAFLFGITGSYDWSKVEFSVDPGLFSASIDSSWSVGGRAGVAVNGILLYVPVGYVRADMSWSVGIPAPELKGWYAGGGFEVPLTEVISVGAEYRFTRYDSETVGGFVNLDTDQHSLVARFTVRTPDLFSIGQ